MLLQEIRDNMRGLWYDCITHGSNKHMHRASKITKGASLVKCRKVFVRKQIQCPNKDSNTNSVCVQYIYGR